jgi:hemolysin activation/secretion protein
MKRAGWFFLRLAGLVIVTATVAQAQTFRQVAPSMPAKKAPAYVAPAPGKGGDRGAPANVVVAKKLLGLRFVSSVKEVAADGFSGTQAIDPGDVAFARQADFAAVVQPFIGQPVTIDALDNLSNAVVIYYRAHDRPIVNVFAPQQNITNGYVQIVVAEGHVGDVRSGGAKWFSNDDLRDDLRLHACDPISGHMLREDLDWMNRNPFHQSDLVFGPGDSPGLTDLTLKTADRFPARVFAGYDDAGNQYTGDYRYFAGFNYGDFLGLDQQLSYQFSTAEDTNEFTAHAGSWVIPLPWRHVLTIYGSYGQSSANVPGTSGLFHSSGTSWQTSFRYEVPLRAPANLTHSLVAGFDFKSSNNNLAFGGMPVVSDTYADTAQIVVGYQAAYTDRYGSTTGSVMAYLSPGGLTSNDSTQDYQAQRYGAKPYYEYGQLNLQRVTTLPANFTWTERGELQISDANLLPSEQIALGGYDTVRGYDEREANGDSGFFLSSEIDTPPISLGNLVGLAAATDQLQFLGFVDYGGVSLHQPGPSDTNPNANLLGVGPGVRWAISPYMSFRFDYGWQLISTGYDSRYDSRGHIGLVMSLPGGADESTPAATPTPSGNEAALPGFIEQMEAEETCTGFNVNVYGGVTTLQESTATLNSDVTLPGSPSSLSADQQSEAGAVGGLHAGYTWKDFTDSFPLLMPAMDGDFFWSGYQYKTVSQTATFTGSSLTSDVDAYTLMLEPKLKFNLGTFRPYIGVGLGGTYIHAQNSNVNLVSSLGGINENFPKALDAGAFSVAGLAGLEYFFDPHWALTFEYKYLYTDAQGTASSSFTVSGTKVHLKYNIDGLDTSDFTGGFSYYF